MPPTPKMLLLPVLLISALCLLSAIGGIVLGVRGGAWFLLAFEVVVLIAAFMGVLVGVGRFRDAPALATLCVGGCVFIAAVLSEPTFVARVLQGSASAAQTIAGVNLRAWALGRIGAGACLIGIAGLMVLVRWPSRSLPFLIRGALLGAPVVASLGVLVVPSIRAGLIGLPLTAIVSIVIVAFFVLGALFSASVQNLILAFDVGIPDRSVPAARNSAQ